jgi:hypothetical protein
MHSLRNQLRVLYVSMQRRCNRQWLNMFVRHCLIFRNTTPVTSKRMSLLIYLCSLCLIQATVLSVNFLQQMYEFIFFGGGGRGHRVPDLRNNQEFVIFVSPWETCFVFNPLNAELNPICHFLALLDHHILHVSRVRVNIYSMVGRFGGIGWEETTVAQVDII